MYQVDPNDNTKQIPKARPVSAAGKAAANTAQRELEDDEPEFSRRIGSEAASGKGTIKDKRGVAQKIIKSKELIINIIPNVDARIIIGYSILSIPTLIT